VLAGVGSWGASWVGELGSAAGFELAAVADPDRAAAHRAAAAAGLSEECVFESISSAAAALNLDVAVVAVPPAAHAVVAIAALDAGLHCLVEKPLAPSVAEAAGIAEHGEAVRRIVMVSQNYRFRAGARTVRRLLAAGAVGRIGTVDVQFRRSFDPAGYRQTMDEPLLLDMAIHHFDQLRAVLGIEPTSVWARTSNPSWSPFAGNAEGFVRFETDDKVAVSYVGNWASVGGQTGWGGRWEIQGDAGAILWEDDRIVRYDAPDGARSRIARVRHALRRADLPLDAGLPSDRQGVLAELRAAIRDDRVPEAGARDNLRTLALVNAAIESARSGASVALTTTG
jgi:predicted dehydrogenase